MGVRGTAAPSPPWWSDAASGASARGNQGLPAVLASHGLESRTNHTDSGSSNPGYIAYFLIPVFFLMGLLGVLICHLLKRKGYRCTTEAEQEEEKLGEKIELNESTNDHGDTVGQIVNYIMKNEANADVLQAMVADDPESPTTPGSPTSPGSPLSPGGSQSKSHCHGHHHLHTVGGIAGKGVCTRCSQKRWNLFSPAKRSKEARKGRHGEVTVLSVGRFRVTKVEHKSASKEHKNVASASGEKLATPIKEGLPAVRQASRELRYTPVKQEEKERSGTE